MPLHVFALKQYVSKRHWDFVEVVSIVNADVCVQCTTQRDEMGASAVKESFEICLKLYHDDRGRVRGNHGFVEKKQVTAFLNKFVRAVFGSDTRDIFKTVGTGQNFVNQVRSLQFDMVNVLEWLTKGEGNKFIPVLRAVACVRSAMLKLFNVDKNKEVKKGVPSPSCKMKRRSVDKGYIYLRNLVMTKSAVTGEFRLKPSGSFLYLLHASKVPLSSSSCLVDVCIGAWSMDTQKFEAVWSYMVSDDNGAVAAQTLKLGIEDFHPTVNKRVYALRSTIEMLSSDAWAWLRTKPFSLLDLHEKALPGKSLFYKDFLSTNNALCCYLHVLRSRMPH